VAGQPIRLGTRGSALALAQARSVAEALGGAELVEIATSGDRGASAGDKSRFTREIEDALLAGEVEVAVHSAKDLPAGLPPGLELAAVPARENPADCYVGQAGSLGELPPGTRIGTSSLRRRSQLLALRADLIVEELRGNVDTRLAKVGGSIEGAVLAAAGLRRLGRFGEAAFEIPLPQMTPAPGQGALALEIRAGDQGAAAALAAVDDPVARAEVVAERAAVAALEAGCHTPLGVHARIEGDALTITGFAGLPDGSEWIRDQLSGEPGSPEAAGRMLAERMRSAGAAELLERAESMAGSGPSAARATRGDSR
jgi:hydroxymethylbilane synthase